MSRRDRVLASLGRAGAGDPLYGALLAAFPVVAVLIALGGRTASVVAVVATYVLAFPLAVLYRWQRPR